MTTLVTGGTGAIGSFVSRALIEHGEKVVAFDIAPRPMFLTDILDRMTIVRGDVLDVLQILRTINEHRIERVVHLAADLSAEVRANQPFREAHLGVMGTGNILELARQLGLKRVL